MARWDEPQITTYRTSRYDYDQPPPMAVYGSAPQKMRFSKTELIHLFIAGSVLTVAFALAFSGGLRSGGSVPLQGFPTLLGISAVVILTAFICHELGHKFLAQKYDCWAEFRFWRMGLILALITGVLGFVFAAPGAVQIRGRLTREQSGKISIIGPVINIALALIFLALMIAIENAIFVLVCTVGAYINAFLAFFNLIPFPPLDGSKVWRWNKIYYLLAMGAAIAILALFWF